MNKLLVPFCLLILLGAGCSPAEFNAVPLPQAPSSATATNQVPAQIPKPAAEPSSVPLTPEVSFGLPLDRAAERVTKKPFGTYVRPGASPVSPERFIGYHTGVDFETFEDEQERDVEVRAICDGELALKKISDGYGSVVVQRCRLEDQPVTVMYGHLRFESIEAKVGDILKRGEKLGLLGKGYSSETDGERKHLHLGLHRGTALTVQGYVQAKAELGQWLDARLYLPL